MAKIIKWVLDKTSARNIGRLIRNGKSEDVNHIFECLDMVTNVHPTTQNPKVTTLFIGKYLVDCLLDPRKHPQTLIVHKINPLSDEEVTRLKSELLKSAMFN